MPTPFQSRAWLRHWLEHRGNSVRPFPLVLDDGETIAPLGLRRSMGIRVLQLLGSGDSDFTGLISTREPAQAWDVVIRELARRRHQWDLLHLHSVYQRDEITQALQTHLGRTAVERIYEWCPSITMEITWDQFLARRKKLRYEVKRWGKRLEEQGAVSVEAVRPPLSNELLNRLVEIERASWRWEQGNPAFKPGSTRDFLFALLTDPTTPARVWLLRVGEQIVAASLVLEEATRWFYYLTIYHQDYKNAGSLLLARIVEGAHAAGCRSFSLLRGEHGYKEVWADDREPVYEMVCPSNLRGQAAATLHRYRWEAAKSQRLRNLRALVFRVGDRRENHAG